MKNPFGGIPWHDLRNEGILAAIFIVIGLGVITFIQLAVFPFLLAPAGKALSFPNLGITSEDWNTVRAIWFAEVPLAFLLRRILGGARVEYAEAKQRAFDNIITALDKRGIKDLHTYVKVFMLCDKEGKPVLEPVRKNAMGVTGRWPVQMVGNKRTHKILNVHGAIAVLAGEGVVDYDQSFRGTTKEDLVAHIKKDMGDTKIQYEDRDADVNDLSG